ncbi:ABC transporter ATP-binding protein [Clostridium hydrogenum]|uniref:ABC transporter ATP-binding protein n=1 Tax=Clostridium hydrogenum TaxID=2855764 RepID=UPI001F209EE5|nr:ABC transporter ATP-binding protein [Clostridium hydrogenum]
MSKLKALFKYTRKYKNRYILGMIFLILVDILQIIPPKLIGIITDNISNGKSNTSFLLKTILCIILIYLLMSISRFMWRMFIIGTSKYIEYDIRNKFFKHIQKLSQDFYSKNKTGDLMSLATNDLNAVRMALGFGIVMITDSSFLSILTICIMLSINVRLTLFSLIPLPLIALSSFIFGKKIYRKFLKVQKSFSNLTDVVQESFSGIRVIKSYVQEKKEFENFTNKNEKNLKTNMSYVKLSSFFSPLIEFISSLSFVVLVGIGGVFVIDGYISLGDFISFNMYLSNLVWPMMAIGGVINTIQRGFASLERIENVLNIEPIIYDKGTENLSSLNGDIVIKNLSFNYSGSNVNALNNINLNIKCGQTLGILGKTGSGKTTLINLLLRLYNVDDNHIFINNTDINKIPLSFLRENIGVVTQEAFLFSNSISENINLANETLNMDDIISSAKASDVYDNIIDFPDKFNTLVGERGVSLSGGQKQRISISRALIKNPEILIFDDCLSAVDAKTEVKILENLKKAMKNKTSIIISHRISALKNSDIIAVMDNGSITDIGTHETLIKKPGLYREIYEKQSLEDKIAKEGDIDEA